MLMLNDDKGDKIFLSLFSGSKSVDSKRIISSNCFQYRLYVSRD